MDLKSTFHTINLHRKGYFDQVLETYSLNMMELEILVFLAENPGNNTFTEILKSKDYAKSHVSMAVSRLIAAGYVDKCPAPHSRKVFYLQATDLGVPVVAAYETAVTAFRKDAFREISPEHVEIFQQVLGKVCSNLTEEISSCTP